LRGNLNSQSAEETLHSFRDVTAVATWAESGVAATMQVGIVTGRSTDTLAPKGYMTQADVAAMIQRLLKQLVLI